MCNLKVEITETPNWITSCELKPPTAKDMADWIVIDEVLQYLYSIFTSLVTIACMNSINSIILYIVTMNF